MFRFLLVLSATEELQQPEAVSVVESEVATPEQPVEEAVEQEEESMPEEQEVQVLLELPVLSDLQHLLSPMRSLLVDTAAEVNV